MECTYFRSHEKTFPILIYICVVAVPSALIEEENENRLFKLISTAQIDDREVRSGASMVVLNARSGGFTWHSRKSKAEWERGGGCDEQD